MTDVQAVVLLLTIDTTLSIGAAALACRANTRSRTIQRRLEHAARRNVTRRQADEHLTQPNGAGR